MKAGKIREESEKQIDYKGYAAGIVLTLAIAFIADLLTNLPFFSIMGIMILAILLGALWSNTISVPLSWNIGLGTAFSSKYLLRAGIILLGFRLNFADISAAGPAVFLIDAIVILFTMSLILFLGKVFQIDQKLAMLIAAGTAICGAAAIVAIAPIVKSEKEKTAIAVSIIAMLGTIGALGFIFLYPYLPLTDSEFGMLVGGTLHELAHVVAAAVPGGDPGSETAILVKLGRVILLIPVALIITYFTNRKERTNQTDGRKLPIPWFIFGFLFVSMINTFFDIPSGLIDFFLLVSTYLLAMGMAGLGINIKWAAFARVGIKPIGVGVIGFIGLLAITPVLLWVFRFFS